MRTLCRAGLFAGMLLHAMVWAGNAEAQAGPKCRELLDSQINADRIGLPTRGATITRTQFVAEPSAGAHPYCLISGEIAPIDPKAPNIEFQVALPTNWNEKALMLGGGGFGGVIQPVAGSFRLAPPKTPTPLALGYAVFASDSGHQVETPAGSPMSLVDGSSALNAGFLGNMESYRNYMGDAVKKTRDVAIAIIEAAYGRGPRRSYFHGGAKGGGEAVMAAARWPEDWDGVAAWSPGRDWVLNILGVLRSAQSLAAPGAYLNLAERGALHDAAMAACDGLDGVRDGIISDEKGCRLRFDPAKAMLNGVSLRCPDGRETQDICLTDAQIGAVKQIEAPAVFVFMPEGQNAFPGFNMLTADLGGSPDSPLSPIVSALTMGMTAPTFPSTDGNWMGASMVARYFRFGVAKNNSFDVLRLNLADPGPLVPRLLELAQLDSGDHDLSGFVKRGGKMILLHGTGDMLVSPRATEHYVDTLRAKMGADEVGRFLRFYEIPGFGHDVSTVFNARVDDLALLDAWVERGDDPGEKVIVAETGHNGRTRPLCLYPHWPKYKGSGSPDAAASFICARH